MTATISSRKNVLTLVKAAGAKNKKITAEDTDKVVVTCWIAGSWCNLVFSKCWNGDQDLLEVDAWNRVVDSPFIAKIKTALLEVI